MKKNIQSINQPISIEQLVGSEALTKGIQSRALESAIKIQKNLIENIENLKNKHNSENEILNFDDLFNYMADPQRLAIESYINDENSIFVPENIRYTLDEAIKYDIK